MGLFSSIGGAISSAVSGVCSCVGRICSGIAGALDGSVLGGAVASFVMKLGTVMSGTNILSTIIMVADIVCRIAEVLGIKEKDQDEPDELAMKAEKDYTKPDDFDSMEDYIKHLQKNIEISKEEKEKLDSMSPEERAAYRATGTYLYAKACNEKLGFEENGLKKQELTGLTADVLGDLAKLENKLSPSDLVVYSRHLHANGMGMKEFSDYLHNRSADLSTDEKVQSVLTDAMKELNPAIAQEEINRKLYAMNIEDNK